MVQATRWEYAPAAERCRPASVRSRLGRVRRVLATAGLLTAGVLVADVSAGQAGDMLRPATAQEQMIEAGIPRAFNGIERAVRCLSPDELRNRRDPFTRLFANQPAELGGVTRMGSHLIWLSGQTCDRLSNLAQYPPQTPRQVAESGNALLGAETLGHEAAHTGLPDMPGLTRLFGTLSEPAADCVAAQVTADVAIAFGANPALRAYMTEFIVELKRSAQQAVSREYTGAEAAQRAQYGLGASCTQGSAYDLGIQTEQFWAQASREA